MLGLPPTNKTHGLSNTKTYRAWRGMRERCLNPKHKAFKNYGGRGITICERWNRFENFLEDMGLAPIGMSLDKIDNNKGYSKENCRWATVFEQNRNRRGALFIEHEGKMMPLGDAADKLGVKYDTLYKRIKDKNLWIEPITISKKKYEALLDVVEAAQALNKKLGVIDIVWGPQEFEDLALALAKLEAIDG